MQIRNAVSVLGALLCFAEHANHAQIRKQCGFSSYSFFEGTNALNQPSCCFLGKADGVFKACTFYSYFSF